MRRRNPGELGLGLRVPAFRSSPGQAAVLLLGCKLLALLPMRWTQFEPPFKEAGALDAHCGDLTVFHFDSEKWALGSISGHSSYAWFVAVVLNCYCNLTGPWRKDPSVSPVESRIKGMGLTLGLYIGQRCPDTDEWFDFKLIIVPPEREVCQVIILLSVSHFHWLAEFQ